MYHSVLQNEVRNVGSIELICLICWLKIVMIIHVSFCTTCRKCGMWDKNKKKVWVTTFTASTSRLLE
jgi:hypothetical protein